MARPVGKSLGDGEATVSGGFTVVAGRMGRGDHRHPAIGGRCDAGGGVDCDGGIGHVGLLDEWECLHLASSPSPSNQAGELRALPLLSLGLPAPPSCEDATIGRNDGQGPRLDQANSTWPSASTSSASSGMRHWKRPGIRSTAITAEVSTTMPSIEQSAKRRVKDAGQLVRWRAVSRADATRG